MTNIENEMIKFTRYNEKINYLFSDTIWPEKQSLTFYA